MSEDRQTTELTRALRGLRPTPGPSPGPVMYLAGRASLAPAVRFWRRLAVAGILGLAASWVGGFVLFMEWRNTPDRVEHVWIELPATATHSAPPHEQPHPPTVPEAVPPPKYVPPPEAVVQADPENGEGLHEYLRIRRDVLAHGVDALPSAPSRPATRPPSTYELEHTLDLPVGVLASPYRFR